MRRYAQEERKIRRERWFLWCGRGKEKNGVLNKRIDRLLSLLLPAAGCYGTFRVIEMCGMKFVGYNSRE